MKHPVLTAMIIASVAVLGSGAARADAIDGDWCAPEGKQSLSIERQNIRTPGGARITGSYTRHSFSYVAPAGDPEPGAAIDMMLMGETRVRVQVRGGADAIWRRCLPGVS